MTKAERTEFKRAYDEARLVMAAGLRDHDRLHLAMWEELDRRATEKRQAERVAA